MRAFDVVIVIDWGREAWQVFEKLNAVIVSVTSRRLRKVYIKRNK